MKIKNEGLKKLDEELNLMLKTIYLDEFELIDGLNQHPTGLNFHEWLDMKLKEEK